MNIDIEQWRKEEKERQEKWKNYHFEKLTEKFPELKIDQTKGKIINVTELYYQLNNNEYYISSVVDGTYQRKTDFYYEKQFLKEYDTEFKILESNYYIYLISDFKSFLGVKVSKFIKDSGKRVKNVKTYRKVYTNNKGSYITLDKKKLYL